ncbi:kelch repeat-containing F-box-like [Hordeum vulgare]|nr:kelch repeat-containing F-box-like [Hordeum vulgare]
MREGVGRGGGEGAGPWLCGGGIAALRTPPPGQRPYPTDTRPPQALPPLAASGPAHKYAASAALSNSYRLVLHDPVNGGWATLPPLPGGRGLPLFCQLAAVSCSERRKLVVLGGWDPETWVPTDTVHVYDFLDGAWRSGAPMPGPRRSFFACAAVGGRVFVGGGHDEEKNALRSAAAYDAEANAWAALPDMALQRDEARGSASAPVLDRVVDEGACPRTCCTAPSAAGAMYMLRHGHLAVRDGDNEWRAVAPIPKDGRAAMVVVAIEDGRVAAIGAGHHGGEQAVYVLSKDTETNGASPS